jgi:hypothetical protein
MIIENLEVKVMIEMEIQETLEEENEMQKCICCGLSFVQKSEETVCFEQIFTSHSRDFSRELDAIQKYYFCIFF